LPADHLAQASEEPFKQAPFSVEKREEDISHKDMLPIEPEELRLSRALAPDDPRLLKAS
jgi:hypothetical protein